MTYEWQAHSCALLNSGATTCWGYNVDGQVLLFYLLGLFCCNRVVRLYFFRFCDLFFLQLGDKTTASRYAPDFLSSFSALSLWSPLWLFMLSAERAALRAASVGNVAIFAGGYTGNFLSGCSIKGVN